MLTALLPAVVIAIILGAIGALYFGRIRRRQDEAETGVRALSALRWREFSHFVLDAMRHRGYEVLTSSDEAERGQQTEFLLERHGERALLSCKHGSAYRLTRQSITELGAAMKFQGALSGLLVTPGKIESDARKPADKVAFEAKKKELRAARIQQIRQQRLQAYFEDLRKSAKIDDRRKEITAQLKRQSVS